MPRIMVYKNSLVKKAKSIFSDPQSMVFMLHIRYIHGVTCLVYGVACLAYGVTCLAYGVTCLVLYIKHC